MRKIRYILAVGCACFLAACETPKEVRTQSAVVSAQVAKVRGDLSRYAADEKRRGAARADRVISVLQEVDAAEERSRLRLLSDQKQWLSGVLERLEETENARTESLKRQSEIAATVRAAAKTFDVPSDELKTVEEALSKIALKTDRADQLKFFLKYAKSVAKNYKELRDESEEKAKDADALSKEKASDVSKNAKSVGQ